MVLGCPRWGPHPRISTGHPHCLGKDPAPCSWDSAIPRPSIPAARGAHCPLPAALRTCHRWTRTLWPFASGLLADTLGSAPVRPRAAWRSVAFTRPRHRTAQRSENHGETQGRATARGPPARTSSSQTPSSLSSRACSPLSLHALNLLSSHCGHRRAPGLSWDPTASAPPGLLHPSVPYSPLATRQPEGPCQLRPRFAFILTRTSVRSSRWRRWVWSWPSTFAARPGWAKRVQNLAHPP